MASTNKGRILAVCALMLAVASVTAVLMTDCSEDSDGASTYVWYSYGLHLEFEDRNYDQARYEKIEWVYSKEPLSDSNPGEAVPIKENSDYVGVLDLSLDDYPYWVKKPLFVREIATMTDGDVKTLEFRVDVNPIPDMCYFEFMYDDTHQYIYMHVTRLTSFEVGVTPVVDLPPEPIREGYTFGGWYKDKECTDPFDNMDPKVFESNEKVKVYPKWTATGGSTPSEGSTYFVMLQTVNGLDMECNGLAVQKGSGFSFTVSVAEGFRFDTSEMIAVTSTGKILTKTDNPDGSITYTLPSVDSDVSIFVTGYQQYFKVTAKLDNVTAVGFQEWVLQDSSLTLPLTSTVGGDITATVFMGTSDVTGNVYSDGTVRISSVTGDVSVYASSSEKPEPTPKPGQDDGDDFPWKLIAIIAIIIAIILAIIIAIRTYRGRE